jgi:hypothetical protein
MAPPLEFTKGAILNIVKRIAVTIIFGLICGGANISGTLGQESTACPSPGTMIVRDAASSRADIIPSLHKQLAGIGRFAAQNGCNISLVCVRDPSKPDPVKFVDQMCRSVRDAIAYFEPRRDVRRTIYQAYKTSKRNPGGAFLANDVHITVY